MATGQQKSSSKEGNQLIPGLATVVSIHDEMLEL